MPILDIKQQSTVAVTLRKHFNNVLKASRPNWKLYTSKDVVKASLLAAGLQSLALSYGLLQLDADEMHRNVAAIQEHLQQFVLTHSPDQLHLVLNEPRSVGGALSEFTYPDLEALAFPKAVQDQVCISSLGFSTCSQYRSHDVRPELRSYATYSCLGYVFRAIQAGP